MHQSTAVRFLFYIMLALIGIWLVLTALSYAVLALPFFIGCAIYAKHERDYDTVAAIRGAFSGGPYQPLVTMGVISGVLCVAFMMVPGIWQDLRTGSSPLISAIVLALDFAVIASAAIFYSQIVKGHIMKDIFTIMDGKTKFDDFASEFSSPVVIEINPEKLRIQLKAEVIGQDVIVDECVDTLARRCRLQRKAKPLGVFMYVGASGAGKTELAKAIAKHAFENRLCRYDMNEFTEAHSTQRLIGAPPGYMGSDQGGQLTQDIKRMKSGVILFDEIEKAHSDVYKLIMGLLDEGRMTEQSTGKTMDATKFIIVMTSNAEHEKLAEIAEKISDLDDRRRAIKDTLQVVFKPEQLARIDEVFCFKKLDKHSQARVIGKFLFGYAADIGVELAGVDADLLIDTIKRHEKQSDYGIRELVRLVEKQVCDGMMEAKDEGFAHVSIRFSGDKVSVHGVRKEEAA